MVFNKAHSTNSQFLPSNSVSISQELLMPTPNKPNSAVKSTRDLAWCIAPTLLISFKYAWAGFRYAFISQRNFRIHTIIGTLAISLGVFLHLTMVELSVIALTSGLVMAMELLNTAIESVVDLTVKQSYHELAKIAKDCAAGAVLISAIASVLVAGVLIIPPLWIRIQPLVQ